MSSADAGRGFERAPGRSALRSCHVREVCLRDAEIAKSLEATEPRELLDRGSGRRRSHRPCQGGDGVRHDRLVETQRRREAERVEARRATRRSVRRAPGPSRGRGRARARRAPCRHASRPRAARSAPRGRVPSSTTTGRAARDAARLPWSRRRTGRRRAPRRSARGRSSPVPTDSSRGRSSVSAGS